MFAVPLLELDLAVPMEQTSESTCAGCAAKPRCAGPCSGLAPAWHKLAHGQMLLLGAECSTCQALQPGNCFVIKPHSGCTMVEPLQDCTQG